MKRIFSFLAAVALVCEFSSTTHAEQSKKSEGFFKAAFRDMERQLAEANARLARAKGDK